MTPVGTDDLLARYLGSNLQTATIRLVVGVVGLSAIVALIVWLI